LKHKQDWKPVVPVGKTGVKTRNVYEVKTIVALWFCWGTRDGVPVVGRINGPGAKLEWPEKPQNG
jgi:hypothetical protein